MSESKYNHLIQNTIIFAIGKFGSKVLTFLIVPLYTYYLSTEEYGEVDLFITAIELFIPFLTLQIQDATIRFLMAREIDEKIAVSNSMLIFIVNSIIAVFLYPMYSALLSSGSDTPLFLVLLVLTSYNTIFSTFLQASGRTIAFSINGVIITSVTVFSNLILVVGCKMGMHGYLISLILAQLIASVQATIQGQIFQNFSFRGVNFKYLTQMLKYSVPIIPSALMFWIINAGDKFVIKIFLDSSANGLYSFAAKIPAVLSQVFAIFMQAWELSAIEERDSKDCGSFYSNVFTIVSACLFILAAAAILLVKPFYLLAVSEEFYEAWKYVPLMTIGTVIDCFSFFAETVYVINKDMKKSFTTALVGAVVNVIFNFLLVHSMRLHGITVGSIIGYISLFLTRYYDAKKYLGMHFGGKRTLFAFLLLFLQTGIVLTIDSYISYVLNALCLLTLLVVYKAEILNCIALAWNKITHRS